MKSILTVCCLLSVALSYAQSTGKTGIGTLNPTAQIHTTASVGFDTLKGVGLRPLYVSYSGVQTAGVRSVGVFDTVPGSPDHDCNGDIRIKGFLAQEVEEVLPNAVTKNTGVIPNIYKNAEKVLYDANARVLVVRLEGHGLVRGDRVKLVTDDGEKTVDVVAANRTTFAVGDWRTNSTWAFVYGKEVADQRSLDYNKAQP